MPVKEAGQDPFPQPNNPAGYGKWYGKVTIPKDGDPANQFTFLGITDLTNRTNWLAWRIIDIRNGGVYANAVIQFNGPFVFGNGTYPLLDPPRSWERRTLRIYSTTREQVDTSDPIAKLPDAWITTEPGYDAIETRPTQSASRTTRIELTELPDGGKLTQVTITTIGKTAGTALAPATFRVGRFKGAGAIEWISALVTDTHVLGDFLTTAITKTITCSPLLTIDRSYTYVLVVTHSSDPGSPANPMYIQEVVAIGTAARLGL